MSLHIDTPLLASAAWRSAAEHPVLFKMDALQPSGSFKLRGVGCFCEAAAARGETAIICASGGNAGMSTAMAGQALGLSVTIVVPQTTSSEAREAIAAAGATLLVHGTDFDAASQHAADLANATDAALLHPFDDPLLWEGHATLVDEVVSAEAAFDCVVTSVGGGGLLLGIVEGLRRNGLANVPIIAVETDGAASLNAALAAGEPVTIPAITSLATSLGARRVATAAFDACSSHEIFSVTVTDAQAVDACRKFADAHRVLVEPACGAAIAALDVHHALLARFSRPLVEVCGGIGISLARLAALEAAAR